MKKLSNTEAELKKVLLMKKGVLLLFLLLKHSLINYIIYITLFTDSLITKWFFSLQLKSKNENY